jgi:hypothetical protein
MNDDVTSSKNLANHNKININNNTTNMISSFTDTIEDMKTLSLVAGEKEITTSHQESIQPHKLVSVQVINQLFVFLGIF